MRVQLVAMADAASVGRKTKMIKFIESNDALSILPPVMLLKLSGFCRQLN